MEHTFVIDDLKFIIYKFLDDAIDNIHPLMETEDAYCNIVTKEQPNRIIFEYKDSHTILLFSIVPWYAIESNTLRCYHIKFRCDKSKIDLIEDSLKNTSKISRLLFDKFKMVLAWNKYSENISNIEFQIVDIIAIRIDDIYTVKGIK